MARPTRRGPNGRPRVNLLILVTGWSPLSPRASDPTPSTRPNTESKGLVAKSLRRLITGPVHSLSAS